MTHKITDFQAFLEQTKRERRCRRLKARRLDDRLTGGIVLCGERYGGSKIGVLISLSPETNGWRISRFDEDGFFGHADKATRYECILECLKDGYHDSNRNFLGEMMLLDSFHAGNEKSSRLQVVSC